MSTAPTSPGSGTSESVQNTVEKEMRRRKLLVGLFVVLLLVPVGVAVLFLSAAPTASAPHPVAAEVVTPQVQVNDKALAALQQQVDETRSLAQGTQASLQQLSSSQTEQAQQVEALRGDLQQTRAAVQHTHTVMERAESVPHPVPAVSAQNAALQRDVETLRSQVADLSRQLQQVQQQNALLQRQVTTINRRFETQPIHPQ
jgi:peptidoglycan hydrolase CwlO-like protein